ncbi:hypothetical protein Acr_00g0099170 [Actinidia rufa]|uniref:Uncharacterized protein n=1 Tax=Actinidia rufa TaxID=165716 RepID=A0A7J0E053_9ERIC|nr:hypothetical protein Acr_00g0099170 [Actinidia rufa]
MLSMGSVVNLVWAPKNVGSVSLKRFCLSNDLQPEMVRSVSSCLAQSDLEVATVSELEIGEVQPRYNYQDPKFFQSIYPLLTDLNQIFVDLPLIGKALSCAQKMLFNVERGEVVDARLLSEVRTFQLVAEGLRIALNNAARALLLLWKLAAWQALKNYWKNPVSLEVKDLAKQLINKYEDDEERVAIKTADKKLLSDKPMVAVGAGATATLGASSISKIFPLFTKLVALKIPVSFKFLLTYPPKGDSFCPRKIFGPSKVVAHGIATYGAKSTPVLKAAAYAQKILSVAHALITSAERSSLSIMRIVFYQIMRKRGVQLIGVLLWTTFGFSGTTFAGLFVHEENIECAAESLLHLLQLPVWVVGFGIYIRHPRKLGKELLKDSRNCGGSSVQLQ